MKAYLAPDYLKHMALVLAALKQLDRQNDVRNPVLKQATIFNVDDEAKNDLDNFDVEIKGGAEDCLIRLSDQRLLWRNTSGFTEIWHFDRQGDTWILADIEQQDAESAIEKGYIPKAVIAAQDDLAAKMEKFADANGFYYNADFGWLLLPDRGLLFGASAFGRSDINFHVIGQYNQALVQFYQYVPYPDQKRQLKDYFNSFYKPYHQVTSYIVAQTVLPKSYSDIVVQHRSGFGIRFTPRGMRKVSLESADFNKRYTLYAAQPDEINSLELLNPAYMEKLYDLPFVVSMEIVGNNLYLFSTDKKADFDSMLGLVKDAFAQMKA
jgi:hypothetical protein